MIPAQNSGKEEITTWSETVSINAANDTQTHQLSGEAASVAAFSKSNTPSAGTFVAAGGRGGNVYLSYNSTAGEYVRVTPSLSADGRTVSFAIAAWPFGSGTHSLTLRCTGRKTA